MNITSKMAQVQQLRADGLEPLVIAERTGLAPVTVRVYCTFLNRAGGDAQLASRLKSLASMSTRGNSNGRVRRKPR